MRYEVKRIAIWPFIKVSFFINLLIGFIFGLFYSPIVSVIMMLLTATPFYSSQNVESAPASWGALLFVIPFLSAFLAGCVNTLIGLVLVLAYNMFAVLVGGLEFELETVRGDAPPAPPAKPIERPANPTIYADTDEMIPPPPPPPPVQPRGTQPSGSTFVDPLADTGRVTDPAGLAAATPPLTTARPDDTMSKPGLPPEPYASEPASDRPDDSDTEGKRA